MIDVNVEIKNPKSFHPYKTVDIEKILTDAFPNKEITNSREWNGGAEINGIRFNTIKSSGKISIQMHFDDMRYKKVWRKVPIIDNQIDEIKLRAKHQELLDLLHENNQAQLNREVKEKAKDDLQAKMNKVVEQHGLAGYECRVQGTERVQLKLNVNPADVEQLCKLYSELKKARE